MNTPEHDLLMATDSPHATDLGKVVFDDRCRRCWYGAGLAEGITLSPALIPVAWPAAGRTEVGEQYATLVAEVRAALTGYVGPYDLQGIWQALDDLEVSHA